MNLISSFNVLHQMSTTHRYSNTNLSQRENILEHTGFVCVYASQLLTRFLTDLGNCSDVQRAIFEEMGVTYRADPEPVHPEANSARSAVASMDVGHAFAVFQARVMFKAAIHDVEETITGDVVRPIKYHSEESLRMFKEIENVAALTALTNLGAPELHEHWKTDKSGLSGMFVRVADILAVVFKVYSECSLNGSFTILKACASLKTYLKEVIEAIHTQYPSSDFSNLNRFFVDLLQEAVSVVKSVEAAAPRIASFENIHNQ